MCLWNSPSPFRDSRAAGQAGGLSAAAARQAGNGQEPRFALLLCLSGFFSSSASSPRSILRSRGSCVRSGGPGSPCPDRPCGDCCGQRGRAVVGSVSAVCLSAWSGGHWLLPRSLCDSPGARQIASLVLMAACPIRGAKRSPGARAGAVCAFELLLFLLPETLGESEQLWGGLCRGGACTPLLNQASGPWVVVRRVKQSLGSPRVVGPAAHLLAWAGEFLLTASACRHALRPSGWLRNALSLKEQRVEGTDPRPGVGGLCCRPGSASRPKRGA